MAPLEPVKSITLRAKVPPGHIEGVANDEFLLGELPTGTTIGALRLRIQDSLPGHPAPQNQRLLYGGRALVDNEQSLAEALNVKRDPAQDSYVIHLLVKGDGSTSNVPPSRRVGTGPGLQGDNAPHPPPPTQIQTPATQQHELPPGTTPGVNEQWQNHQQQARLLRQQQQRLHAHLIQSNHGLGHFAAVNAPPGMQQMHPGPPPNFSPFPLPGVQVPFPGYQNFHNHQQTQREQNGNTPQVNSEMINVESGREQTPDVQSNESQQQRQQQPAVGPQLPQRPVSNQGFHQHLEGIHSNGQRFAVHQFQTYGFPPTGLPFLPMMPPAPGAAFHLPTGASPPTQAISSARQAVADIQQVIEELRSAPHAAEGQRNHLERLQDRARLLNDYINQSQSSTAGALGPGAIMQQLPHITSQVNPWVSRNNNAANQSTHTGATDSQDVTCYLLSSPTGPQALLYSPQHGTYRGALSQQQGNQHQNRLPVLPANLARERPTSSSQTFSQAEHPANEQAQQIPAAADQLAQAQQAVEQAAAQRQAAAQDPMQVLMGHFWLLIRVLIFSYFLLGSNMGWRRPIVIVAIGVGFWMLRMGLFGDGGILRRWWDDIMHGPQVAGRQAQDRDAPEQAQREGQQAPAQAGQRRMPTPEEFARRLLDQEAQANAAMHPRVRWLRERVRPVERAAALFVGSLWPGVGEAAVRAREQEARRRAEEEIAAQRREEEARQAHEEGEKKGKNEAGEANNEEPETSSAQPGDVEDPSPRSANSPEAQTQ